jgi:hypothetical protein
MGGGQAFARDRLEVENVQCLAGGVDDRVETLGRLPCRGGDSNGNSNGLPARNLSRRRRSF